MDNAAEIREFLTSRRAAITPRQAGLPTHGTRRVPGLRRAEVAQLAGISVEYYAKLERGNLAGVSVQVLDALARALRLGEDDHAHLDDLARAAGPAPRRRRRPPTATVRPNVQRLLDSMTCPALIVNGCGDVLAANAVGRALYAPMFEATRGAAPNHGRFLFLDPRSHQFWGDWDGAADAVVALLHAQAGRDPYNKDLTDLIGELSTRSDEFRIRWARHDVLRHHQGTKPIHHPSSAPSTSPTNPSTCPPTTSSSPPTTPNQAATPKTPSACSPAGPPSTPPPPNARLELDPSLVQTAINRYAARVATSWP